MTKRTIRFTLLVLLFMLSTGQYPWANELEQARKHLQSISTVYSQIIDEAKPAVVFIQVEKRVSGENDQNLLNNFQYDPVIQDFFGGHSKEKKTHSSNTISYGYGSGFIYNDDGYILTNNHVIKDAHKVTVTLSDKRSFEAEVIGTDPKTDIGLLKVTSNERLPTLSLGNSSHTKTGELVLAIGSPYKFIQTVTSGIVSATGRNAIGVSDYENFIQTDAAISPGNSGGPLIDINAKVIGINTAFLTQTGGYTGISFAVPINTALNVSEQLINNGKVTRAWLGVGLIEAEQEILIENNLAASTKAAHVVNVKKNSPASQAGLTKGDLITAFNNTPINGAADLRNRIAHTSPTGRITLTLYRNSSLVEQTIWLQPLIK